MCVCVTCFCSFLFITLSSLANYVDDTTLAESIKGLSKTHSKLNLKANIENHM